MAAHTLTEDGTTLVLAPAAGSHTATVVLLHGLGDSAAGWLDDTRTEFAPALPHVKFILPTAAEQAVTANVSDCGILCSRSREPGAMRFTL